jgi:hypothetical protein
MNRPLPRLKKVPLFVPVIYDKRRLDLGLFERRQDAEQIAAKHHRDGTAEPIFVSHRTPK